MFYQKNIVNGNCSLDIFGAEIQYFRLEPQYWACVLDQLVDTGIKTVTTYVQWNTHLIGPPDMKNPAGILDFEGKTAPQLNLLKFLDMITQRGLQCNFRAGPFCCNEAVHGGYPSWIIFDPAISVWDYQNRTTQGYWIAKKEGSQPSYLHPTYLQWCRRWIEAVSPIIRDRLHSSGGCITMVNLDNEVSYIVKDSFLDSDYNPVNVDRGGFWHQFLTEQYGSAGNLPYPKSYKTIEDVQPPRAVPKSITDDLSYYLDWIRFKTWVMCRYISELRKMYNQNGVVDVCFMTNLNPHRPEGIPTRMPDIERATNGIVGYDFYRNPFLSYSGYHSMARILKLMRASMNYVWSAEFMAGLWNKDMTSHSRISADHMQFMARCALAHGCKAISWFMFHDRDIWGDAPVSSHGHRRPSHGILRNTMKLVFESIKNWDALEVLEDVAVIYELLQHQHTAIGDPCPCNDGEVYQGNPSIDGIDAGFASQSYEGLFRIIEQTGRQAGVVDIMADASRMDRFKVAFLPASPLLSDAAADVIRKFIKSGGRLIIDGIWPARNELGKPSKFLDMAPPQTDTIIPIGEGSVILLSMPIGLVEPESEDIASIAKIEEWIDEIAGSPAVRCEQDNPVEYVVLAKGGGTQTICQNHCLGAAVMHRSNDETILFVMNLHPEAAVFKLTFNDDKYGSMIDLDSGEATMIDHGVVIVDVDRKAANVYRLEI